MQRRSGGARTTACCRNQALSQRVGWRTASCTASGIQFQPMGGTPEHVRPLIASHLLSRWKLEMAKKFEHLEWSKQYCKKRELRLKLKEEARRQEQV